MGHLGWVHPPSHSDNKPAHACLPAAMVVVVVVATAAAAAATAVAATVPRWVVRVACLPSPGPKPYILHPTPSAWITADIALGYRPHVCLLLLLLLQGGWGGGGGAVAGGGYGGGGHQSSWD